MSKGIKIVIGLVVAFFTLIAVVVVIAVVVLGNSLKSEVADATTRANTAKAILEDLSNEGYEDVYNLLVSSEFKSVADAEILRDITESTPALDNMTRATVNSQSIQTLDDGSKLYILKGTIYSDTDSEDFEIQFVLENGLYLMSYIALGPDAADEN